jgi:hypothetical protein
MDLAEDHLLIGAMNGAPGADTALQRTTCPGRQPRMAPLHLVENGDRAQVRCGLQHRHDLGVEEIGEWIGASAASDLLLR